MEVARAAGGLRWKLASSSLAPLRLASTAAAAAPLRTPDNKPKTQQRVRRYVPEKVKSFVMNDGKLLTTRENWIFFLKHDIEPDNGRMSQFFAGPDLQKVRKDFNVSLAFSPKHILHPHDLQWFDPRGHPLVAMKKADYARKASEQPLWIMVTTFGAGPAVVRNLTQRRLTRAVHTALEAMGYQSATGLSPTKEIRGTFWAIMHDPVKAAKHSAERFGEVVAAALDKECSRPRT
ncbi:hypothetical protein JDV02_010110 [Purpureocillium takamizusanense]|uniref:Uncharacterized protein n=1 Tax=Purpureocillium takamizusanense TaxID=2060973 RepID=A0A9Q8QQ43_9HYPO|nr:uncharacterized protein JDV02_010110 [Purpureocillium takamizusanense]UNI24358.1 hypothetical protein JDV02_010110 [Purpureocillium takamizusanense]